ncbi:MAG: hypothetical protein ACI82F_003157 [Planctomycetota bacterium]|jgi:hypothetical protein
MTQREYSILLGSIRMGSLWGQEHFLGLELLRRTAERLLDC